MAETLLLLQAAATLAMVGLIWFVQVVHYPLFGHVGQDQFGHYERLHQFRTTLVVAPLMLVEAGTAVLLLWRRPDGVTMGAAIFGVLLVGMIWVSTILWQMPAHAKLEAAFDPAAHRRLVQSNWVRTAAWTARGMLVCWMVSEIYLRAAAVDASGLATR